MGKSPTRIFNKGAKMSEVIVTEANFRSAFPEFADTTTYTSALITRFILMAEAYCHTKNYRVKPEVRILLIELMTAHLITLNNIDPTTHQSTGVSGSAGFETSATVGGVSVSLQAPIAKDAFQTWINSTGYGQQYWALLVANNPVGIHYVGTPRAFGIK